MQKVREDDQKAVKKRAMRKKVVIGILLGLCVIGAIAAFLLTGGAIGGAAAAGAAAAGAKTALATGATKAAIGAKAAFALKSSAMVGISKTKTVLLVSQIKKFGLYVLLMAQAGNILRDIKETAESQSQEKN